MRPSIAHMLDCTIRIWRPTVADDAIGVQERTYVAQSVVDAFINRPAEQEQDIGGGLAPSGSVRWYGLPTIDVRPRDVCEVASGTDIGRLFEVNAPPVRPKNHHTQVDCIEWNGKLPSVLSPGAAFLAGLAAPTKLIAAWKPDKIAKTFNDYKGTRHFVLVEPAPPRAIAWTDDLGGGDLAGFGVGLASNVHSDVEYAVAPWPTLDYFALHVVFRSTLPDGASTTLLGVEQNTGSPDDQEVIEVPVWTTTDPSAGPSAVGLSYVDADDAATATERDMWFQDLPGGTLQPAPDVLTDVCVSLGSDSRVRVWQNGVLILDVIEPGGSGRLWNPAGLVSLFTGNGIANGDGTRWFDNNYVLGPMLLYNDTLTTEEVLANRAHFKSLGYTSLP